MTWFLKRKLKNLGEQGNPSQVFVRSLEMRLRDEIGHPVWWIRWSKIATASCSIVVLASSGTGVYAYNSDEVLPDHPLYAVRQGIERVEETVAVTPALKQQVRAQLERRRERERTLLEARRLRQQERIKAVEERKEERKERIEAQRINRIELRNTRLEQIRAIPTSTRKYIITEPATTTTRATTNTYPIRLRR